MDRRHAGGIAAAADLLSEHGGAIEADLARFYGEHVGDFPWPLTARRLLVLVDGLPEESAFRRGLLSDDELLWTPDRDLLAFIVDELRNLRYISAVAGRLKPTPQVPRPIPRPSTRRVTRKRTPGDPDVVRSRLQAMGVDVPDELLGR